MKFIIDFNKKISEQWKEQSTSTTHIGPSIDDKNSLAITTFHTINPTSIDIYNFPTKTSSILVRSAELKKLTELFELVKLKSWITLNIKESKDLFVSEEFKHFNKVQFDISPLTIDENKLFTDLKQLLQLKNMTIVCEMGLEKSCQRLVNMLQYIIILKNKNYPGIVIFNEKER